MSQAAHLFIVLRLPYLSVNDSPSAAEVNYLTVCLISVPCVESKQEKCELVEERCVIMKWMMQNWSKHSVSLRDRRAHSEGGSGFTGKAALHLALIQCVVTDLE